MGLFSTYSSLFFSASTTLLLASFAGGCQFLGGESGGAQADTTRVDRLELQLAPELTGALGKKIGQIETLAREKRIVEAARRSNLENRDLSSAQIEELDDLWRRSEETSDLIHRFLSNEQADLLRDFQKDNEGFPEIFLTDNRGLIVAETNRTSDYYQADEGWWVRAFDEGRGKSYFGEIEYDDSAQSVAIALYVPVREREAESAIGVIKAVCDFRAIKGEL